MHSFEAKSIRISPLEQVTPAHLGMDVGIYCAVLWVNCVGEEVRAARRKPDPRHAASLGARSPRIGSTLAWRGVLCCAVLWCEQDTGRHELVDVMFDQIRFARVEDVEGDDRLVEVTLTLHNYPDVLGSRAAADGG